MNPQNEIEIVGRHLELTDAIKSKVNEMAEKLFEHDSDISRIRIELEMEPHAKTHHDEFIAKGHVDDHRQHYDVSAKGDDLYKAISDLGEKLDRIIRKSSRRRVTERRHPSAIELDADLPKAGPSEV